MRGVWREGIGNGDGVSGESRAHGRIIQCDFDSLEISIALRHKGRTIVGKSSESVDNQ